MGISKVNLSKKDLRSYKMNLVFHMVFSISNSPICAKKIRKDNKPLKYLAFGFVGI